MISQDLQCNVSRASTTCMHVDVIYMLLNSANIWTPLTLPGKEILSTNMSFRGILKLTYSSSECRVSEAWFKQVLLCWILTCRLDRMTSTYDKCCVYQQVFISGHTLVSRGFRSSPDWRDIISLTYFCVICGTTWNCRFMYIDTKMREYHVKESLIKYHARDSTIHVQWQYSEQYESFARKLMNRNDLSEGSLCILVMWKIEPGCGRRALVHQVMHNASSFLPNFPQEIISSVWTIYHFIKKSISTGVCEQ